MNTFNNRKYINGTQIINEKNLKNCGVIDSYKLIVVRKVKPRKTDDCIRYLCNVFDSNNNFKGSFVLKETTIDVLY